jgi:glycosyltransferase involved in cell wall biosynthesis
MKICFLTEGMLSNHGKNINGTLIQYYNLARMLKEQGNEIFYFTPADDINSGSLFNMNIQIIYYHKGKYLLDLKRNRNALNKLKKINPDIIYVRGRNIFTYTAYKWSYRNKCKFIWATNGDDSCDRWKYLKVIWKSKRCSITKILLTPLLIIEDVLIYRGMKRADQVINQNQFQKKQLKRKLNKEGKILPSLITELKDYKPENKKQILWIGRLSEEKDPIMFINLAQSMRSFKEWKFVIAGETNNTDYKQKFLTSLKDIPNLSYLGFIPYLKSIELISESSFIVNTSIREGLSNTFIQAWCTKTPILSLNSDPNNWLRDKEIGYCADGNKNILFDKCRYWLTNEKIIKQMGEKGFIHAKETFLNPTIQKQYSVVFSIE